MTIDHGVELSTEHVVRWIEAYFAAWRVRDGDGVARLFTPDGVYQSIPGVAEETYVGREAISGYIANITAPQNEMSGLHGTPVITGDRAAIELWMRFRVKDAYPEGDDWMTLIEANFLTFAPDGLCSRNIEYWNWRKGWIDPPEGWGD
jgi:uncharacterized protein (TIGR02246 family)